MPSKKQHKLTTPRLVKLKTRLLAAPHSNVYHVAEAMFGIKFDDKIFDWLDEVGVFRCEECSRWLPKARKAEGIGESQICMPCIDLIDGKMVDD